MEKYFLGLTERGLERRIAIEKQHAKMLSKVFVELEKQIKNTSESDGWQRLILFSTSNELLKGFSPALRTTLLYYLRRHPNIISKLSDKETKSIKDSIKPYLYKWVSAEEKFSLGIKANYFKNISDKILNYVAEKANTKYVNFTDILTVLEFLSSNKKEKWIEFTTSDIVLRTGVLIENTRAALNELLRLKLIVFAYTEGRQRKGRLRQFVRLTETEADYEDAIFGAGIEAVKIISAKNVVLTNFKFTVLEYFYSLIGTKDYVAETKPSADYNPDFKPNSAVNLFAEETQKNVSHETKFVKKVEDLPNIAEVKSSEEKTISPVAEKIDAPVEQNPPVVPKEIVEKVSPEFSQAVNEIKNYMTSFVGIAESIYKNEEKKFTAIDNLLSANAKQREENEELKNQIESLKKTVNRQERDKYLFIKKVQDSLNMMMGQIISETDTFMKIPRHLMSENTVQKHKADVIKIAVQTSYDIQKVFSATPSTSANSNVSR